jgi:glycosyltransferase involved in cell wall biosynthesis
VGINALFLEPTLGGLETYVRELVPELLRLRPEWELSLFLNPLGFRQLTQEPWASDVRLVSHPLLGRRYTRALSELTVLGWLADRERLDLLHSVAMIAPLRTRAVSVLTVPDTIWLHHPDAAQRTTFRLWRILVPPSARRADRIITLSEAARQTIAADLGVPPSKIDAVLLGPGKAMVQPSAEDELRRRLALGTRPLVLCVSALKEHKNLESLVEAMASVRERVPEALLVIVGRRTPHQDQLERTAAGLGIGDALRFPGWISDADLEGLYRCASCLAFPSLLEGFGLPILEAMRRGTPVACSDLPVFREVAGEAALYFDPHDPAAIAAATLRLVDDRALAAQLSEAGLERQRRFTWEATAMKTIASYERAAHA